MLSSPADLHIGLFIPTLSGGGAERVFTQLANGLARRVKRVDLLVGRQGGHYQRLVSDRVSLLPLGKSRTAAMVFSLRRYMLDVRPSVMLSTMTDANVVLLMAAQLTRSSPPVAIREAVLQSANLSGGRKVQLVRFLAAHLYPRADAIVALSKGVGAELEREIPGLRDPVRVIYNPGPSVEEMSLGGVASDLFLARKAVAPVLVALGRLSNQKDNATLIRAFAKVRAVRPASLWIFGEGEEREALNALVGDLGLSADVFMPGFIADPYPYLKAADVFVMSSRYEGGPSSMLQAMACGCKIVSTDAPSGPAEFLEDGKHGALVPVGDADAFAAAVLHALDEPLVPDVRAEGLRRFEPEYFVSQYLEFLFDVAARSRGGV